MPLLSGMKRTPSIVSGERSIVVIRSPYATRWTLSPGSSSVCDARYTSSTMTARGNNALPALPMLIGSASRAPPDRHFHSQSERGPAARRASRLVDGFVLVGRRSTTAVPATDHGSVHEQKDDRADDRPEPGAQIEEFVDRVTE